MREQTADAFRELVNAYYGDVYRYVQGTVGAGLAERLTADALVQASQQFVTYRGEVGYKVWLLAAVHQQVHSGWRQLWRKRKLEQVAVPVQDVQNAQEPLRAEQQSLDERERHLLCTELEQAMAKLPVKARCAYVLRHVLGLSVAETGIILLLTDGKVRTLEEQALDLLQREFEGRNVRWQIDNMQQSS